MQLPELPEGRARHCVLFYIGSFERCQKGARVILLGPSTPISPILYEYGVHMLSGTVAVDPQAVFLGTGQGASLQQLRDAGIVRLITVERNQANGNC